MVNIWIDLSGGPLGELSGGMGVIVGVAVGLGGIGVNVTVGVGDGGSGIGVGANRQAAIPTSKRKISVDTTSFFTKASRISL
jgi:hypothetical protein